MPGPISPDTRSRLVLPRPGLASCVRGIFVRDTRGAVLDDAQRFNHFPAAPLCSLTWWFAGHAEVLPPGAPCDLSIPRERMAPVPTLAGPHTRPLVSWNPSSGHAMMVMLLPDALHRLTGLTMADWVNRWAAADTVLPPDWQALCAAVQTAPDDNTRLTLLQDFLEPRWAAVRPTRPLGAHRYLDWAQSLAMHAATSAPGRSLRQVERRIKRWSGLPLRELRGLGRAEQAYFAALSHAQQQAASPASPNWAALADEQGYADQSHLCRETRRITGLSPDELYRRIREDESFWAYRVWE